MNLPTMVLLMILVYVIFGYSALPVLWVVIGGLTLKAGSYLADIFNTALSSVNEGEIEAARTLGMTSMQAFRYVTLPQAVDKALPLYENQFIATLQETSVVGYLAVVDLTRAAVIVASRTLDAFTGLVVITLIYFLLGALVKQLFSIPIVIRKASPVICDELLYTVFAGTKGVEATVRLMCSETSDHHTMIVSFKGLSSDPLGKEYIDDVNRKLIENYSEFVFSRRSDENWEVSIQM